MTAVTFLHPALFAAEISSNSSIKLSFTGALNVWIMYASLSLNGSNICTPP